MVAFAGAAAVTAGPVAAQSDPEPSAAQRCFEHHKFGAQPVDVAKTDDGQTVLAQVSWGFHDSIGCYLTLDDDALAALQAAPAPQSLPTAETEASQRCFEHHKFGQRPVDVAKSADRQTVLARLSWGFHDSIGCYLTLDDTALTTLRTAAQPDPGEQTESLPNETAAIAIAQLSEPPIHNVCAVREGGTVGCWRYVLDPGYRSYSGLEEFSEGEGPDGLFSAVASLNHGLGFCGLRVDAAVFCWGSVAGAPAGTFSAIALGGNEPVIGGSDTAGACGIRTDGTSVCWRWRAIWDEEGNSELQVVELVTPAGHFTAIALGGLDRICGLLADGNVKCWGYGPEDNEDRLQERSTLADDFGLGNAADFVNGFEACRLKSDKTIDCGEQNGSKRAVPEGQFTAIASTQGGLLCGYRTDGTVECFMFDWWSEDRKGVPLEVPAD